MAFSLLPQMSGTGYYAYSPMPRQYATEITIRTIADLCTQRRWNGVIHQVGIGDMSFVSGGPMPPHVSHTDGKCVDIRPLRKDGQNLPVTVSDPQYDRDATRLLVSAFLAHKNVKKILFNDPQILGVTPWPGHDNHLHVVMRN